MRDSVKLSNGIVTLTIGLFVGVMVQFAPVLAVAQTAILEELFAELKSPDVQDWKTVETKIWKEWEKSGSAAMDLLLERGKEALEEGRVNDAINHFSALIDHAPEFAEGWNSRATAFFVAGRYGLSLSDIQQTLALNPRHFGAMVGLGQIMERFEKPKKALEIYRLALEVHPKRPDVIKAIERLEKQVEGTSL